ncbi:TerC family protein [Flavobacterium flavipallidum]|uniref:TerC family protein n=1 Tax=Flavobacterium flavipallidum TaxID=3139140 RepID=A0ABU9HK94_9FLAO
MIVWICFIATIFLFLALDLGIFNKTPHEISSKEAGKWTAIWITLSFLFSIIVYWLYQNNYIENPDQLKPMVASMKYITGYLIELSLSIDNIFVIAIIFSSFKIPKKYQHRVLFWGIIGAIVFRGIMIYFGVLIIKKFAWTTYLFGAFLIYTAIKMFFKKEDHEYDPHNSVFYRYLKKLTPITTKIESEHFFVKINNINTATPLFVTLFLIELMDIVFALDSVPAILAITSDPFLVFSSNIFAILGLRSMYFFLANMLEKFSYLEYSLIAILCFVGLKMILHSYIKLPEWVSLGFIAFALLSGIIASIQKEKRIKK